jgi:hypothetical protein
MLLEKVSCLVGDMKMVRQQKEKHKMCVGSSSDALHA